MTLGKSQSFLVLSFTDCKEGLEEGPYLLPLLNCVPILGGEDRCFNSTHSCLLCSSPLSLLSSPSKGPQVISRSPDLNPSSASHMQPHPCL